MTQDPADPALRDREPTERDARAGGQRPAHPRGRPRPRRLDPGTYRVLVGAGGPCRDRGRPDLRGLGLERRELPGAAGRHQLSADSASTGPRARGRVRMQRRAGEHPPGRQPARPRAAARRAPGKHRRPASHAHRGARPLRPAPAAADHPGLPGRASTTASPRRREAVAASPTTGPTRRSRRSSSTSGSWSWTGVPVVVDSWHQSGASADSGGPGRRRPRLDHLRARHPVGIRSGRTLARCRGPFAPHWSSSRWAWSSPCPSPPRPAPRPTTPGRRSRPPPPRVSPTTAGH